MENDTGTQKSLPESELSGAIHAHSGHTSQGIARWLQVLAAVLLVGLLGGGFLVIQTWRAPHPAPFASLPKYGWCTVPGPGGFNPNLIAPQLNGIAAVAPNDAWIAGIYDDESLIEHWNGARWNIVPTPDLSSQGNYGLFGIAAISASDVWAVGAISPGYQHFFRGVGVHTLIEHWDGSHWSVVPGLDENSGANELIGVSALAANDIWAVGDTSADASSGNTSLLVEHWDGNRWSVVQIPASLGINQPTSIAAASANDIWVLGQLASSRQATLLHWNGHQWSLTPAPGTQAGDALDTLTVGGEHDIWAAGNENKGSAFYPLLGHWDGTHWNRFPVPHTTRGALGGLLALSSNNIWVAERGVVRGQYFEQMLHWDGKSWHAVSQQHASDGQLMFMAGAGNRLWAIGDATIDPANPSARGPLIETNC